MDLKFITENFVPVIIVACVLIGYIIKVTPSFDKFANNYIPLIVTVLGAIMGVITNGMTLEAIVYGAVSGLASTGLHQTFTQILNIDKKEEE